MSKILLKRLSASDLTLFKYHFDNTAGTKQKAINLDADPLITSLYPSLPDVSTNVVGGKIPIAISFFGPGKAGEHAIARKILKQQKNWRLNGEYVHNPDEQPQRYNSLQKGDFALLEFHGDIVPQSVRVYLIAQASADDRKLHESLTRRFGNEFSARRGMLQISNVDLQVSITDGSLAPGHPVLDLLEISDLEDAAQGGITGIRNLATRRASRPIRPEELQRAKANAEKIGRFGEELYNYHLEVQKAVGQISEFEWTSDENAVAPYDFSVVDKQNLRRLVDVKATSGEFGNRIHVSFGELLNMRDVDVPYDICRMYNVTETDGKFRLARDVKDTAGKILETFTTLPQGVSVDGVSTAVDIWKFESKEYVVKIEDGNSGPEDDA